MEIRILSFEGCPNVEATVSLVKEVLRELGLQKELGHSQIHDESEAFQYRFLGSPSVQIDGKDMEAERREDAPLFGCRLYTHGISKSGVPSKEMIIRAIEEARHSIA